MRFLELDLIAFGPFEQTVLNLANGDHGLHVVHGLNEAGKSSALRAIHAVLFGIPSRRTDNFRHDNKKLRIGACLQNSAAEQISVVRRKGNKETLLNPDHSQGGAFPDSVLDPFLSGTDTDSFQRVFGIGHEELRRGGDELKSLRGLVGESLYDASLGGTGLSNVIDRLNTEAADLFTKRNSRIKGAKKEYTATVKQKRDAETSAAGWKKLQKELTGAQERLESIRDDLRRLREEQSRLKRIRQSLRWVSERSQLLEELAGQSDVRILPESYSAKDRNDCQRDLRHVREQIASLTERLDGESGVRSQLQAIQLADGLIDNETVIEDLKQHLGAHLKAARDRTHELLPERNQLRGRAEQIVRDLQLEVTWEAVSRFRIPSDRRVAISNLASMAKTVRDKPRELAEKQSECEAELTKNRAALDELNSPVDVSAVSQHLAHGRKHGDLDSSLAASQQDVETFRIEAERSLNKLDLWSGTLLDVAGLPIPLAETIDQFETRFADLSNEQKELRRLETGHRDELGQVRNDIETLRQSESVPSEEELSRVRNERDDSWSMVRGVWLDGESTTDTQDYSDDASLADAYEECVNQADLVADRLRREAERVTHLARLRGQGSLLEQRLSDVCDKLAICDNSIEDLYRDWKDAWQPLRINDPLSPREMRAWIARLENLRRMIGDIDESQRNAERVAETHATCCARLTESLTLIGVTPSSEESLELLLERAHDAVERESKIQQRRQELARDITRLTDALDRIAREQSGAVAALEEWQKDWRDAMQLIGCPADAPVEQVNQRLSSLDELFKCIDSLDECDGRIQGIDNDADAFRKQVKSLVDRLAPDLSELPAEEAAAELGSRLGRAREDKVRRDKLNDQIDDSQSQLENVRVKEGKLESQLRQFCETAGVNDEAELEPVERCSADVVDLRSRLSDVEEQLRHHGAGLSVDEIVAEADGHNADELDARISELDPRIEQLEADREEQAGRVREIQNQCDKVDGSTAASEADERAIGLLSQLQTDAEHFIRLRLAATILRQQIDSFRSRNQDPLLARASDLFSRMTCGEFRGIQVEYQDDDQPVIVGVRDRNDEHVHVEGMSDGTRDQLYLSLRLGYVEQRLSQSESMPFVVDDILVNFDDKRSLATLNVLIELSRLTQVIFFTHHNHLVELAESTSSSDEVFVHRLASHDPV